jgi:hypothetical protein
MALTANLWARHGRAVTIIADAFVHRVETEGGVARGVTWRVGATGDVYTEEAYVDTGIPGYYDNGLPGGKHGADAVGRLVGRALKEAMAHVDRLLNIDIFTDDDVERQNGMALSTTFPPDEHGPVPRIEIRHRSARTIANREFLVGKAVALLRALGATKVYRIKKPPFVIHSHCTMRMGIEAATSVLDSTAEARGVQRLFVADNSALANGLGGPNPTLTTLALATRTAEQIFRRYFGGDAWVHREAPLSSVDSAVTRAVVARGL